MSDMMLLNIDPAISLQQRMAIAADELDFDAQALAEPLTEASDLLGGAVPDSATGVRRIAADLRSNADDLHKRIQMVLAGGREMNAGLAALEQIRASFTLIETRGHSDRADGKLSLRDLEWARHQLDEETSAGRGWLADNDDFFARVETAKDNDTYINKPTTATSPTIPKTETAFSALRTSTLSWPKPRPGRHCCPTPAPSTLPTAAASPTVC